jgi:hypothetical protein
MRLAQLARKLSVRPSQIVDLLAQEQIFFEDGSNAKLNDDVVRKVLLTLAPNRLSEIMAEQVLESEPETESVPENKISEPEQPDKVESKPVAELDEVNPPEEIIRAPKVELAGLKVLGKIDLPQSRKQEEVKTKTEGVEPILRREQRERRPRQQREEKPWRNPIALQREREAREKEERKQAELREEKERKRQQYLARVKPVKPIKAMRIYDEPVQQQAPITPETKPRTWVGKFLKWLNTP